MTAPEWYPWQLGAMTLPYLRWPFERALEGIARNPNAKDSLFQPFILGLVFMEFQALLGFVIMGVATDERTPAAVAPFAIGLTVFAGALVTGPLTGGSFNPARTLGPAVASGVWTAHWLYWIAPTVGMLAGMHAYRALRTASVPAPDESVPLGVEGPL